MNIVVISAVVLLCLFSIGSVLLLKYGYKNMEAKYGTALKLEPWFLIRWVFNPFIFGSLALAMCCRIINYYLVGTIGIQYTNLIGSIAFPLILFSAYLAFGETLTKMQMIGSVLIFSGVLFVGMPA